MSEERMKNKIRSFPHHNVVALLALKGAAVVVEPCVALLDHER